MTPTVETPQPATPWCLVKEQLDGIRNDHGTKVEPIPDNVRDNRVLNFVLNDLRQQGKLLNCPEPAVFLNDGRLVYFIPGAESFSDLMSDYGVLIGQRDYKFLLDNIASTIRSTASTRQVHRLGMITNEAIYVNAGNNRVIKITETEITEQRNGVDGVILVDNSVKPWPSLETDDNQEKLQELSAQLKGKGLGYLPETPLGRHFSCLFGDQEMTPEQAQQMLFARLMFLWVANAYSLWPLLLILGEQNTGKSTIAENLGTRWLSASHALLRRP